MAKLTTNKMLLLISLAAGLLTGIFRPMFFNADDLARLANGLQYFVTNFGYNASGTAAFAEAALIYGRPLLLIWACAALPRAVYASYILLYLRAMTFGFATAMMVRTFGGTGLAYAAALYFPQNLLVVTTFAYTISQIRAHGPNLRPHIMKIGLVGLLGVLAAVIFEVFITPAIFSLVR